MLFQVTHRITKKHVEAATGTMKGVPHDLRETGDCPGLYFRVGPRKSAWYLKARLGGVPKTWRIKTLLRDDDPKEIRKWAAAAKLLISRGIDPTDFLREKGAGGQIERHFDEVKDGWLWERGRDYFLDFIEKNRAPATFLDYRKTLKSNDFSAWIKKGMLLKNITKKEILKVREDVIARGAIPQAEHLIRILKSCLKYLSETGISGIDESPALTIRTSLGRQYRPDEDTKRVPDLKEIGVLPWLLDKEGGKPFRAGRLALMIAVLTAQRRETIITARPQDIQETAAGFIWAIPAHHMKGKRPHVIPLPPVTAGFFHLAMELSGHDGGWIFPQTRLHRAGNAGLNHMDGNALAASAIAAGSEIRPHACRRFFATWGEARLGLKRSDTKAILDHAEGQSGDVTAQHYALHDGQHFKWKIMEDWENFIIGLVTDNRPDNTHDLFPSFFPIIIKNNF